MASTDNLPKSVTKPVNSHSSKQAIRAIVTDFIKTKFANTLAQVPDMVNIFMALIYKESTFNSKNSKGPNYGRLHTNRVLSYPAVSKIYNVASAIEKANIINSAAAYGLCQVSGYYCVKGSGPMGKSELERLRPDLAGPLLVTPGVSVTTKLWGDDNISNQILAGLIVLEGKYKEVAPRLVSQGRFSNKINAAVGAYLGLGAADSLGTTPEAYVNSIIRGEAYQIANNGVGPGGTVASGSSGGSSPNTKPPAGPEKTAASGNNLSTAGC